MKSKFFFLVLYALTTSVTPDRLTKMADWYEGVGKRPVLQSNFDFSKLSDVTYWFCPLESRYEHHRCASTLLNRPDGSFSDDEIESACYREIHVVKGAYENVPIEYMGKLTSVSFEFLEPQVFRFKYSFGGSGKSFVTLTDNKFFAVTVHIWDDDGAWSWAAASPYPKRFPPHIKKQILDHVASLGFDPSKAAEQDFSKCYFRDLKTVHSEEEAIAKTAKNEL